MPRHAKPKQAQNFVMRGFAPLPKSMSERIEIICRLDKQRQDCRSAGDFDGLRRVAGEYAEYGMMTTANEVLKEAG